MRGPDVENRHRLQLEVDADRLGNSDDRRTRDLRSAPDPTAHTDETLHLKDAQRFAHDRLGDPELLD